VFDVTDVCRETVFKVYVMLVVLTDLVTHEHAPNALAHLADHARELWIEIRIRGRL
jgi:hypothetical protein